MNGSIKPNMSIWNIQGKMHQILAIWKLKHGWKMHHSPHLLKDLYLRFKKKKYTPTIWPQKEIQKTIKLQNVDLYVILGTNLIGSMYLPVSQNKAAKVVYDVIITLERTRISNIYINFNTTLKTVPSILYQCWKHISHNWHCS